MSEFEEFNATLQSLGEDDVRTKLAQGVYANKRKSWAENWLRAKEASHAAETEAAALSLAGEGNVTAREANNIAKENLKAVKSARNAAWAAAIAAIIAAACAVITSLQSKP